MMKVLTIFLGLLTLIHLPSISFADPYFVSNNDGAVLRAAPNSSAESIAILPKLTNVDYISSHNKYKRVVATYEGIQYEGYVWYMHLTEGVILTSTSESTTIPEYNGVYVRTSDGRLTRLSELNFSTVDGEVKPTANCPADVWICSGTNLMGAGVSSFRERDLFSRVAGNPGSVISMRLRGTSEINSLPTVSNADSIVVRQRNPNVRNLFVGSISKLSDFLYSLESTPSSDHVEFTKSPARSNLKFIDVRWGCGSFSEKILDNFTSEFSVNNSCDLGVNWAAPGAFQGSSMNVVARFVQIDEKNYGYVVNGKQRKFIACDHPIRSFTTMVRASECPEGFVRRYDERR